MTKRGLLPTVLFGALTAAAALIGTIATRRSVDSAWYRDELRKPRYQPPKQVFPIVWTALYVLMARSAARVWQARPSTQRNRALALWGTQLALNAGWSVLFFGVRRPKLAVVEIGALLAAVSAYAVYARRVDRRAAYQIAPYVAWTSFATVLNADIVRRNDDAALHN